MRIWMLSCFAIVCMLSTRLQCTAETITQEQAIARAREFCQQVGWKPVGEPEVSAPEYSYRDVWEVEFPADQQGHSPGIMVDVERTNGQVYGALNFVKAHMLKPTTPVKINGPTAKFRAQEYLACAGVSLVGSVLERSRAWISGSGEREWELRYVRQFKGYTFHMNDGIEVSLDPTDGTLVSFAYFYVSPLPPTTQLYLKRDEAIEIARAYADGHLKGKRMVIDGLSFAKLYVVQPNDYYEHADMDWKPTSSRLAWVVEFTWDKDHIAQVWVDAENGKVLGGVTCR